MTRKQVPGILLLVTALSLFFFSNHKIIRDRKHIGAQYSLKISSVPPDLIKLIAGEFNGLFADYILLKIASFTGSYKHVDTYTSEELNNIDLGFRQSIALDPYFQQTYLLAQSELAWSIRQPKKGIRILNISRHHRTWDFRPGFYEGFNYYYFLGDFKNAAIVLRETSKVKNVPLLVPLLASRFSMKEKKTEASIRMLLQILSGDTLDKKYKEEIQNRIIALNGVLSIEKALTEFHSKYDFYPETLSALVSQGIIDKMPHNPYHSDFIYDPINQTVHFDHLKAFPQEADQKDYMALLKKVSSPFLNEIISFSE